MRAALCSLGACFVLLVLSCVLMWPQPQPGGVAWTVHAKTLDMDASRLDTQKPGSSFLQSRFRVPAAFKETRCYSE